MNRLPEIYIASFIIVFFACVANAFWQDSMNGALFALLGLMLAGGVFIAYTMVKNASEAVLATVESKTEAKADQHDNVIFLK